jgi:hypothetical protein
MLEKWDYRESIPILLCHTASAAGIQTGNPKRILEGKRSKENVCRYSIEGYNVDKSSGGSEVNPG